jgi:hypothetical protein
MAELRARVALAAARARRDGEQLLAAARREARTLARGQMSFGAPAAHSILGTIAAQQRDLKTAIGELRQAAHGYDAADMAMHAAATRMRLGRLVGGDEGARLEREAEAWMSERGVRRPERLTAMLAPGFPE